MSLSEKLRQSALLALGFTTDGEEALVIRANGEAEYSRFSVDIDWRKGWPKVVVRRDVTIRHVFSSIIGGLIDSMRDDLASRLNKRLGEAYNRVYGKRISDKLNALAKEMCAQAAQALVDELTQCAREPAEEDLTARVTQLLQRCSDEILRRFKQEVIEQNIAESVARVIQKSRTTLLANLGEIALVAKAESGSQFSYDDWLTLPQGVRHVSRRGNLTIMVVEQAPQTRTIRIKGVDYFLAFPFTVFVLVFGDHQLSKIYVFFNNCRFTSLNHKFKVANMSDLDLDGRLHSCGFTRNNQNPAGEEAENAIGYFWQANFRGYGTPSGPLFDGSAGSLKKWEQRTRENPRFALDVEWRECQSTLAEFIQTLLNQAQTKQGLSTQRFDVTLKNIERDVRDAVRTFCDSIPTEQQFERTIRIELRNALPRLDDAEVTRLKQILNTESQRAESDLRRELERDLVSAFFAAIHAEELLTGDDLCALASAFDLRTLSSQKRRAKKGRNH